MNSNLQKTQQEIYQNDEIDIFELGKKIYNYKKAIAMATGSVVTAAAIYAFTTTSWYQVSVFVETGYYRQTNGTEMMIASSSDAVQMLSVSYIDLLKNIKGLDYRVTSIKTLKDNKKFFNIEVIAKSNDIAIAQIKKMIANVTTEHQKLIDGYLSQKKIELSNIERQINFLKNNTIISKQEQIKYIKNFQLPRIDRQIEYINSATIPAAKRDLEAIDNVSLITLDQNIKLNNDKLKHYQTELTKLKADKKNINSENLILRQMTMQGFYQQIDSAQQSLIALEQQRAVLLNQTRPAMQERLDKLVNVDLVNMQSEKDVIISDTLPKLERELVNLQTEELAKLLDQRSLIEFALQPHNYQNTHVVADIIASDRPAKPKKLLIITISFLVGLIMSVFGVLVYDVIKNRREAN